MTKPKKMTQQEEGRKPRCLVLSGFGLNSEAELAHAFDLAGADAKIAHFSDVARGKEKLENCQIFAIPGGWSFGDDISAGRMLSNKFRHSLRAQFESFIAEKKPVLGICNGFQVLTKLGALPNLSGSFGQESTLAHNSSARFEDRWVYLKPQKSLCPYFQGVPFINCPLRHGEGKFTMKDDSAVASLERKGQVVLKYVDERMREGGYPVNPNGSARSVAGICDPTGRILGLMPHPECSVNKFLFPRWTAGVSHESNSLRFFENIVKVGREYI
jgi:phosphoribosylformylglycinamidine synthase